MVKPTIDALTATVPQLGQAPAEFDTNTDEFLPQLVPLQDQINVMIDWTDETATAVAANAAAALISEAEAENAAFDANADAEQTALDRIATGEDATATAEDLAAFRANYLGELSADPVVDGNGDPVQNGAWYSNTTIPAPRLRRAGQWVTAVLDANGALMAANSLADLPDVSAAQASLGLKPAALADYATQAEAEAGTNSAKPMNALRTKQAIAALVPPAPAPGLVPIGSAIDLVGLGSVELMFSGGYDAYTVKFWGCVPTLDAYLAFAVSINNGASFGGSLQALGMNGRHNLNQIDSYSPSSNKIQMMGGNNSSVHNNGVHGGANGEIRFWNVKGASHTHFDLSVSYSFSSSVYQAYTKLWGADRRANEVHGMNLFFNATTFAQGKCQLYGVSTG